MLKGKRLSARTLFDDFDDLFEVPKQDSILKIINNKQNIIKINNALKSKNAVIFVRGPIGSGKTTLIKHCLSDFDYTVYNQEFEYSEICDILTTKTLTKKAIILKNFELTKEISQFLNKSAHLPVFITTRDLSKIKWLDNFTDVIFELPSPNDLFKLGKEMFPNVSASIIKKHAEGTDLNNFIESLKFGSTAKKDKNYDDIKICLKEMCNMQFNDKLKYTSLYTNAVIHENYIKLAHDNNKELNTISQIADILTYADMSYNYLLENQSWDDPEINNYMYITGTIYPLKLMSSNNSINDIKTIKHSPIIPTINKREFQLRSTIKYALMYIIKEDRYAEYIRFLKENYDIPQEQLHIICRFSKNLELFEKMYKKNEEKKSNVIFDDSFDDYE